MLIDDVIVRLKAGKGGDGAATFSNIFMQRGPTGASGGKGGDIILEGASNLDALKQFRFTKEVEGKDGERGGSHTRDGAGAPDTVLRIPVGTVVTDTATGEQYEITKVGEQKVAVRGGRGGRGNFHFKSSTNQTPKEAEKGKEGEEGEFRFELKLIADVGLVGLPNAGKSSLLNELTNASSKVANYPFTTLEPNLGVYFDIVIADIPGLIEGAAEGKGLGVKFLRHVERTERIFHLVSAESEDVVADYKVVREELLRYSEALGEKQEFVFLSKSDAVSESEISEKLAALKKEGVEASAISIIDESELAPVTGALRAIAEEKQQKKEE